MTPPAPNEGPTESYFRGRDDRRPDRRVVAAAFAASVLLHFVAILLYPVFTAPHQAEGRAPTPSGEAPRPAGTQIVRIVELPDDDLDRPDEPERERPVPPVTPRAPTPRPVPGDPGRAADEPDEAPGRSAAARIRATVPDLRLIAPLPEDVTALSAEQIAQLELIWALAVANDSAALAAARARAVTDWTVTDDLGRRWGLSPEGLHLGDYTIPLPNFGAPYDPNAWKGSIDADLERGAASAAARDTGEGRARAIRERIDRERRQPPDTTGGGGGGGEDG